MQKLMKSEEVADLLQVKTVTVVKWRTRGGGPPFIRTGGLIRYRRSDVVAYLDGRTVKPGEGE